MRRISSGTLTLLASCWDSRALPKVLYFWLVDGVNRGNKQVRRRDPRSGVPCFTNDMEDGSGLYALIWRTGVAPPVRGRPGTTRSSNKWELILALLLQLLEPRFPLLERMSAMMSAKSFIFLQPPDGGWPRPADGDEENTVTRRTSLSLPVSPWWLQPRWRLWR